MYLGVASRVSIAELIFYLPAFWLALFVCFRQTFRIDQGWIFLNILATLRVVGAAMQLAAANNGSSGLITGAIICQSVGQSPLILAMLGLLKRVHGQMNSGGFPGLLFLCLHVPVGVALALAIVGGVKISDQDPSTASSGHALEKVAIIIFLAIFLVLACICIYTLIRLTYVPRTERIIVYIVALSIPFLLARLIYSIISAFDWRSVTFNIITGSVAVRVVMATMEEFVIVIIYLIAGFVAPVIRQTPFLRGHLDSDKVECRSNHKRQALLGRVGQVMRVARVMVAM